MSNNRKRLATQAALIVSAVGGFAAIIGLPIYLSATAAPLHPQPDRVSTVMDADPLQRWAEAVEQARHVVRAGVAGQNLPGLSVAVGDGDDLVWAEGFGWADIKTRRPVTPSTRFRIGTASTVLTSAAVGVLMEQNRLKLDDEIRTYVPQFPKTPWPVTLRQLMGHVGGIGTDEGGDGPLFRRRCERPVEALPHIADRAQLFQPGTQYRHSKYGWIVASAAVEAAADQPFLTFMQEQIFEPLGMDRTGAESAQEENPEHVGEPSEDAPPITFVRDVILAPLGIGGKGASAAPADGLATFYVPRSGADPRQGMRVMIPHNLSCYAGAMAFLSTPSDLVRFGLAIASGRLLQPTTVRLLQTSQQLTTGQETGYGLGWDLATVTLAGAPAQAIGHDGESRGGMVVSLLTFRESGIVVAVMSNVSHADTSTLARQIADTFAQFR